MTATRYRKRPIEVDARPFTAATMYEVLTWIRENGGKATEGADRSGPVLIIQTLEGNMRADLGDWIIRGVQGEFYPCKPDIFAATYAPADGTPAPPADWDTISDRVARAINSDLTAHKGRLDQGLLGIVPRLTAAVLGVLPEPADRAAVRAEAFRDAAGWASLNVHAAAADGVRRWLLVLADDELRRVADEAQPDGAQPS
ncbi:hypothetical protein OHA71_23640 [Streptomyces sp. NBC_00444]|uniref:hypothetical protein n=1 Tax=Streptomyces sp. NBC_00444 TaxID=2975744 RepID=UPI002E2165D8